MKPTTFRLLPILLFAFQLSAQCVMTDFIVEPQRPLHGEDVDVLLRGSCTFGMGPSTPRVRVEGHVIFIDLLPPEGGPLAPSSWGERVFLGRLLPGTWDIVVRDTHGEWERKTVVVRERPFSIAPNHSGAGVEVVLHGVQLACATAPCPVVRFGGVEATGTRLLENGDVVVTSPPHDPGLVDVTVTTSNRTFTLEDGFRYGGVAEDDYERVLLPVTFSGPGAQGSQWQSTVMVKNNSPVTIDTEPIIYAYNALPLLLPLSGGSIGFFPERAGEGGSFLYFTRGGASRYFAYSSHITDRSRSETDLGSELPVVRARDTAAEISLPNVPVSTTFRARLRIYDFDTLESRAVSVFVKPLHEPEREFLVHTTGRTIVCPTTPCLQPEPGFVAVDLNSLGLRPNLGPVDIRVRSSRGDARLWAFVTVTNNETQRVTMHTPLHERP
jgi:IPT/TIG domain